PRSAGESRERASAGPLLQLFEPRVLAQERHVEIAGGAVALLGDDQRGDTAVLFGRLVDLLAVQEQDDVRVLLDGARLAQIRELRPTTLAALLGGARQLRDGDDRDVQLLRQLLQRARDLRHFLVAVLEPAAAADELHVIDDDEIETLLQLQTPALGAHLQDGQTGRVVDVDAGRREPAERLDQLAPPFLVEAPGAQEVAVDARQPRQHPQEQL